MFKLFLNVFLFAFLVQGPWSAQAPPEGVRKFRRFGSNETAPQGKSTVTVRTLTVILIKKVFEHNIKTFFEQRICSCLPNTIFLNYNA